MNQVPISTITAGIGAFELKRTYQQNMFFGVVLASGMALAVTGGTLFFVSSLSEPETPPHVIVIDSIADLMPPPPMVHRPKIDLARPKVAPPSIGIPTPVPDEEVIGEVEFATRDQLAQYTNPFSQGMGPIGENSEYVINIPPGDLLPTLGDFVFAEEMPVQVYEEIPVYPEMAVRAGIEGIVWVSALVDKDGRVRDTIIRKPSGTNAGFEEAALAAAMKNRYRPALQNGRPVAVWVSYRVVFELR